MPCVPGRQAAPAVPAFWKCWRLTGLAILALSACAGDPAEVGITGPYPEGVAPVTLTRALPRAETSDDTPGVRVDSADRMAPNIRSRGSAAPTRRYYGYDH